MASPFGLVTNSLHSLIDRCAHSALIPLGCCSRMHAVRAFLGAALKSGWPRPLGLATNSLHSRIASCAHSALLPLGRGKSKKDPERSRRRREKILSSFIDGEALAHYVQHRHGGRSLRGGGFSNPFRNYSATAETWKLLRNLNARISYVE